MSPFLLIALAFRLALIPFELYRSTDFEVHRNWLAITHSLPLGQWYFEETSQWTLDYPPLFALFEWMLSQVAAWVDPQMLQISNLEYASFATVAFQRTSVVLSDLLLVAGAWRVGALRGIPTIAASLALASPGLIIVDHVHFQYNGLLLGLLLLSAADLEAGRIYRGSFLFCILLNMKQIFLYVAPVYFVYLLRVHCGCGFGRGRFGIELRILDLLRLGSLVVGVFAVVWAPFVYTGQMLQAMKRLFPFGRGLTHAYWAPNVWALYNTIDRVLAKLGFGNSQGPSSTAGFAEVYESSVLWTVPPKATFALTLMAYAPLAILIWRQSSPTPILAQGEFAAQPKHRGQFTLYLSFGCAIAFAFGWHVHEKAILMVTLPLLVATAGGDMELRRTAITLSALGTFSMFPLLPHRTKETVFKWVLAIFGHVLELGFLRVSTRTGRGWIANTAAAFQVGPLPGGLTLLGMLLLGAYFEFGHEMLLPGKLEFLPLMLISDFSAVLVLAAFVRLYCLIASVPGQRNGICRGDVAEK